MLQRGEDVQPIAFGEIQLAVAEILPQVLPTGP